MCSIALACSLLLIVLAGARSSLPDTFSGRSAFGSTSLFTFLTIKARSAGSVKIPVDVSIKLVSPDFLPVILNEGSRSNSRIVFSTRLIQCFGKPPAKSEAPIAVLKFIKRFMPAPEADSLLPYIPLSLFIKAKMVFNESRV